MLIRHPINNEEKDNNPFWFVVMIIGVIILTYIVVSFIVNEINQ